MKRALALGVLFGGTACSLSADHDSVRVSIRGPAADSTPSAQNVFGGLDSLGIMSLSPPATVDALDCFALNVSGPGLTQPFQGTSTNYCGPVATSGLAPIDAPNLSLKVPSGPQRRIQVLGIQTGAGCPLGKGFLDFFRENMGTQTSPPNYNLYELGSTTVDLFKDTAVQITSTYNPSSPTYPFQCGSGSTTTTNNQFSHPSLYFTTWAQNTIVTPGGTVDCGPGNLAISGGADCTTSAITASCSSSSSGSCSGTPGQYWFAKCSGPSGYAYATCVPANAFFVSPAAVAGPSVSCPVGTVVFSENRDCGSFAMLNSCPNNAGSCDFSILGAATWKSDCSGAPPPGNYPNCINATGDSTLLKNTDLKKYSGSFAAAANTFDCGTNAVAVSGALDCGAGSIRVSCPSDNLGACHAVADRYWSFNCSGAGPFSFQVTCAPY